MILDSARPRPSIAVFAAFDGLPVPLVVRARNGRIRYANARARARLALDANRLVDAGLTRLGSMRSPGPASFALTVHHTVERRVEARCSLLPGSEDDPIEVLLLLPLDEEDVARGLETLDQREATDVLATALRGPTEAEEGIDRLARQLVPRAPLRLGTLGRVVAEVIRRLRRRAGGDVRLALSTHLDRRLRAAPLDAIAATELVLSAWEILTAQARGGMLRLSVREERGRLRFEFDAAGVAGVQLPDLRERRVFLRSLRPPLLRLGATFEVHSGGSTRRVVVTLPIRPPTA